MQDIPLIDISAYQQASASAQDKTVRQVEQACHDIGFMTITGHGIPAPVIARMRRMVMAYFEQPAATKLRQRISRDDYRGFIPPGFFTANSGTGQADTYEGYKLHYPVDAGDPICAACDLYGPNKWPDSPPGFAQAVLEYWRACDGVAARLLDMFALILGVERDYLLGLFDSPLTNMTLLHYPQQDDPTRRYGIHPHKDTDAFTILVPDPVGGLMVKQTRHSEWLEVQAPPAALVVNIGDLLELWSGGYFVSTPHKVVNKHGAARYSFPYFAVPRYDVVVTPLVPTRPGFARGSVHVGDVSREVWRTNWPDAVPASAEFDLGTLAD